MAIELCTIHQLNSFGPAEIQKLTVFEPFLYTGDLNTGLVWYSNSQKLSDTWMVWYSNGDLNTGQFVHYVLAH